MSGIMRWGRGVQLSCYMDVNSFFLLYIYLCIILETPVSICFISYFCQKLISVCVCLCVYVCVCVWGGGGGVANRILDVHFLFWLDSILYIKSAGVGGLPFYPLYNSGSSHAVKLKLI